MSNDLKRLRDEAALTYSHDAAHPIIRSMYPSKSRGEMAKEFAHAYNTGADWMAQHAHLIPEVKELEDKLYTMQGQLENAEKNAEHDRLTIERLKSQLEMSICIHEGGLMRSLLMRFHSLNQNAKDFILAEIERLNEKPAQAFDSAFGEKNE